MSVTRVESDGSIWLLDDDRAVYLRMPKTEKPRDPGPNGDDWGGPGAGVLQDLRWLPMLSWRITELFNRECLVIDYALSEKSRDRIVAPGARVVDR